MGADSDEEEKRANRARAAKTDESSAAEGRNQSAAADVSSAKATGHATAGPKSQLHRHEHVGSHG